ncbi:MAG TPA: HAD family phosphatase [Verrucomicrobiae bacterium]|nr:HAD family phosphatase [Verrucomicrobiae bacterium]
MTRVRAVIFDMDGVIVDSEPRHERAFLEVVTELGYGDKHGIQFAKYVGRTDRELWVDFVTRHQPAHSLEDLLAMKRERVLEILRREQPLFEGLPELIERLAAKYKLGLASGSEPLVVNEVLRFRELRRFFSVVTTSSEVKHGKPAPDIFLHAARLLGVQARECWVVEDSKPGVAAGLAAGMRVIAITNTHPAAELGNATEVVGTYEQIGELLLREQA